MKAASQISVFPSLVAILAYWSVDFWKYMKNYREIRMELEMELTDLGVELLEERDKLKALKDDLEIYKEILDVQMKPCFNMNNLSTAFNVEPLYKLQYDERVATILERNDPFKDPNYKKHTKKIKRNMKRYAGYLDYPFAGSNQTYVKWSGTTAGYGLYANMRLPKRTFIGEYTGLLINENRTTDYLWSYPMADENGVYSFGVDGKTHGNLLRFVNHGNRKMLNVGVQYLIKDGIWHIVYVTTKPVMKNEELLTDYGPFYWRKRKTNKINPVSKKGRKSSTRRRNRKGQ